MTSLKSPRPDFIGSGWLLPSQGFVYQSALPKELLGLSQRKDEWSRLVRSLEQLKEGHFEENATLLEMVSSSADSEIRFAVLRILGHAATHDGRLALRTFFRHPVEDTRLSAYDAALYCCDLRLIEPLLAALRGRDGEERLTIMSRLSHMLEPEPNDLYDDAGELSQGAYENQVIVAKRACESQHGTGVAIFEGRPLSLRYLVDRAESLCEGAEAYELSGTISMYFDIIEAMTGRPTVGVFDREVAVNRHAAISLLADLHRSGLVGRFEQGRRYFFGHAVPS